MTRQFLRPIDLLMSGSRAVLRAIAPRTPASLQGAVRRLLAARRDVARAERVRAIGEVRSWEFPPCALCGGTRVRHHFVFNGFRIVECRKDGLIFVSPRPVELTQFYDEQYYTGQLPGLYANYAGHARAMESEWSARLTALDGFSAGKERLLDVGAATGDFLVLARRKGWTVAGIEASSWAAQKARDSSGLDMITGDLRCANVQDGAFDVVTMWDCIEHLADPSGTLRAVARVLAPGGVLAISTGSVPHRDRRLSSAWYYPPWHLYYFSTRTLTEMCEAAGFSVLDCTVIDADSPYALLTMFARRVEGKAD